jgi:hypothetical protein
MTILGNLVARMNGTLDEDIGMGQSTPKHTTRIVTVLQHVAKKVRVQQTMHIANIAIQEFQAQPRYRRVKRHLTRHHFLQSALHR